MKIKLLPIRFSLVFIIKALKLFIPSIPVMFFLFSFLMSTQGWSQQQEQNEAIIKLKVIKSFKDKHYEEVLTEIKPLLARYPKDPELNFYSGVAYSELGRNLNIAIEQLRLSSLSKGPQEVYFYLGKALYQNKNYVEALKYFKRYEDIAPKESQKNLQLETWLFKAEEASGEALPTSVPGRWEEPYVEQINDAFYQKEEIRQILGKNDLQSLTKLDRMNLSANRNMKSAWELEKERNKKAIATNTANSNSETIRVNNKIKKLDQQIIEKKSLAFENFQVINDGKYKIYKRNVEKILTDNALDNYDQIRWLYENATINYNKALALREKVNLLTSPEERFDNLGLGNANELLALDNLKKALGTFVGLVPAHKPLEAQTSTQKPVQEKKEIKTIKEENPEELSVIPLKNDTIIRFQTYPVPAPVEKTKTFVSTGVKATEFLPKRPDKSIEVQKYTEEFSILPTPDYNKMKPIPMDEPLPDGICYKVQIGNFSNLKKQAYFKGIQPISAEHDESSGSVRYYGGLFTQYNQARAALKETKKMGFRDAYVVAFQNGQRISTRIAKTLEKELFVTKEPKPKEYPGEKSEVPENTIYFKVQIGVFSKPVTPALFHTFSNYAGEKILSQETKTNGIIVYSIGNFTNFESAGFFKQELTEKGLTDAFITAYEGNHKIPVSEAIQRQMNK